MYNHYVPKSKAVNSFCIFQVLQEFQRQLKKKRSNLESAECLLHWGNAPAHSAKLVEGYPLKRGIQMIAHLPLAP